jgi:Ca2+-binding RTX toxin-like protein
MTLSAQLLASSSTRLALPAVFALTIAAAPWLSPARAAEQIGADNNNIDNPFVQPEGVVPDQSQQNGDVLVGTRGVDVQVGLLGSDTILGDRGRDVQIGGPDPLGAGFPNNDRAFGGAGYDVFLWQPGDGSDFFDGGREDDAVVFGNIANEDLLPTLDPATGLPEIDVSGVGGFCAVIDGTEPDDAAELEELGLDDLVQFFARAEADDGIEDGDNGLRVTLHLIDVEYAICGSRAGGAIEVFDLRVSPPLLIDLEDIENPRLLTRLQDIVI